MGVALIILAGYLVFPEGYRKEPCASSATLPKNTRAGGDRMEFSSAGWTEIDRMEVYRRRRRRDCRAGSRTTLL